MAVAEEESQSCESNNRHYLELQSMIVAQGQKLDKLVEHLAKEKDKEQSTPSEGMQIGRVANGQVEREGGRRTLIEHKWGWGAKLAACLGVPDARSVQASLGVTVYVSSVGMKIDDTWKGRTGQPKKGGLEKANGVVTVSNHATLGER